MSREKSSRKVRTRRSTFVLTVFAAAILATGLPAQEMPDFTGAWTVSEPPPAPVSVGDGSQLSLGSGWGDTFTLIQGSNLLTVERVLYRPRDYQPTMKLRFALDGTESRNTIMMGRGLQIPVSTAVWEGDKLVITTVSTIPDIEDGGTVRCEVTRTLSLQPPLQAVGEASLVVETTRCGVFGGLPSTTRTVYSRN